MNNQKGCFATGKERCALLNHLNDKELDKLIMKDREFWDIRSNWSSNEKKIEHSDNLVRAFNIPIGQKVRHSKSNREYTIISLATIEANLTACVVYQSNSDGRIWVRPLIEMFEMVSIGKDMKRRFTFVD